MGMISELIAESTAKKLEGIILRAMNDSYWGDIRSAVNGFARKELVEWYYDECADTWGAYKPNPEILKRFPPKDK